MRKALIYILIVMSATAGVSSGEPVRIEDMRLLLAQEPPLGNWLFGTLNFSIYGAAEQISPDVESKLRGTRIGPYIFHAFIRGSNAGYKLEVKFNTERVLLDLEGKVTDIGGAEKISERLTSVEITPRRMMERKPWRSMNGPFEYFITVGKKEYVMGEALPVTFTLRNRMGSPQKVQRWRGPLAGVSRGKYDYDFVIYYVSDTSYERVKYRGMFVCGGPMSCMTIEPKEKWEKTYVMNDFLHPAYTLDRAGTYVIKSTYFNNSSGENLQAEDVAIKVRRLNEVELEENRLKLYEEDANAIAITAFHKDILAIPILVRLCFSEDTDLRRHTYKALSMMACDDALLALGEAVLREPNYQQRLEIVKIFEKSGNPIVIPYLEYLLRDPYAAIIGIGDRKYRRYVVRRDASYALKKLGIEDNTPWDQEIEPDE